MPLSVMIRELGLSVHWYVQLSGTIETSSVIYNGHSSPRQNRAKVLLESNPAIISSLKLHVVHCSGVH